MSTQTEDARLRWIVATQHFWAGVATDVQLREAEDAYMAVLEGPLGGPPDAA